MTEQAPQGSRKMFGDTDLREIIDQLLEGYQVIGRDWRYLYVNDALALHGRKTKEELLGRTMMEAYPGIDQSQVFQVLKRCMENGTSERLINEFTYPDGSKAWFQLLICGVPQGVAVMSLDITDQKKNEEEILRLNADLEQRVQQRTEEVRMINKELEAFAYSVSHDLRAPLRAVEGFTRILESDYGRNLDEEGKRILRIIVGNVRKMDQLISDLLALSRVNRSAMKFFTVDMGALASAIFREATEGTEKHYTLEMGELPEAYGDVILLRQVWANLISNAVKYSSRRTDPKITVRGSIHDGQVHYTVSDNGVGFDQAYVHKLFGVFQRLHRDEEFPGTGVGLAIVDRIVRRHQGKVWAEGELGKGASVHFSLPLKPDEGPGGPTEGADEGT